MLLECIHEDLPLDGVDDSGLVITLPVLQHMLDNIVPILVLKYEADRNS